MRKLFYISFLITLASCSISKRISKQANQLLLKDSVALNTNIGISIYEPATNQYWYNHNGEKYFTPASNTKIATCYAAMKYLGDSIVGLQYKLENNTLKIIGTGDPSFLHNDFVRQPVLTFLKSNLDKEILLIEPSCYNTSISSNECFSNYGDGWAWNDFNDYDMPERSFFPIYGNMATFSIQNSKVAVTPNYFTKKITNINYNSSEGFDIVRDRISNNFYLSNGTNKKLRIPLAMGLDSYNANTTEVLLSDTLHKKIQFAKALFSSKDDFKKIYSQLTDSILKPMMHRSDNFFAEQSLLMVSNEKLGMMKVEAIIDLIKQNDLKGIPQMPRWVDGSGLSRYNMFTPQSLVWILNKMKNEFGMDRIKNIFATGGEGTITNYYKNLSGYIFAKTGTLSNHAALSGFLYTQKGKLLIFSILTSGYQGSAVPTRKAVEKFLINLREQN